MPTPKQVRFHYGKCSKLLERLRYALYDAHNADVIVYDSKDFQTIGPCSALNEVISRFNKTTEAQLAAAMREEIRKQ